MLNQLKETRLSSIHIMAYLLDKDGVFEVRSSIQGESTGTAGNGVFCVEGVNAGTILPYYAQAFKESRAPKDMDRTYVIAADFNNSRGNPRTSDVYSMDGNPLVEPVKALEEYKKLGCQINEASEGFSVNCMFVLNPLLEKGSFKESLVKNEPVIATLVAVTEDLPAGTELLTSYGRDYGKRSYKVSKMKRKHQEIMIDKAYDFVDTWIEQSNQSEGEEELTIPSIEKQDDSYVEPVTEPAAEPEPKKVRFQESM